MRVVITGATSGIGKETAKALLEKGHDVTMLVRNLSKAKKFSASEEVQKYRGNLDYIITDLSSLASTSDAADQLLNSERDIDILINNAGGIFQKRQETKDGFEMHFGVNHLAHFLLTLKLMPKLVEVKARVINVSSEAHRSGRLNFNDLQLKDDYTSFKGYANAKLCNIYFTKELSRRYRDSGLTSVAVHPGVVDTGFGMNLSGVFKFIIKLMKPFMIDAKKGASTSIWLATTPDVENLNGKYFKNSREKEPSREANDPSKAEKLWEVSEKLSAKYL